MFGFGSCLGCVRAERRWRQMKEGAGCAPQPAGTPSPPGSRWPGTVERVVGRSGCVLWERVVFWKKSLSEPASYRSLGVGVKIHGESASIDQRCCLSSLLSVAHRFCLSSLLSSILSFTFMASHEPTAPVFIHPPCVIFALPHALRSTMAPHPSLLPPTHLPICARTPPPYITQPRSPPPTQIPLHHLQPPQSSSWRGLRWTT